MPELKLAVNLTGWRYFIRRRSDKAFEPVAKRLLVRDQYTCQYCGFQAQEYQEIINLDGNYLNNKSNNMITACCFCMQCLFLQSIGLDEVSGGQIVYFPELSQADLNSFCHVLFVAMGNTSGFQEGAQTIYRSLRFRSQTVENKFGTGSSNPAVFGQLILEYIETNKKDVQLNATLNRLLRDVRVLPAYTKFKVQLDVWAQAALKEMGDRK